MKTCFFVKVLSWITVFQAIICAKPCPVKALAYAMLEAAAPKTGPGKNMPLHMRDLCS